MEHNTEDDKNSPKTETIFQEIEDFTFDRKTQKRGISKLCVFFILFFNGGRGRLKK